LVASCFHQTQALASQWRSLLILCQNLLVWGCQHRFLLHWAHELFMILFSAYDNARSEVYLLQLLAETTEVVSILLSSCSSNSLGSNSGSALECAQILLDISVQHTKLLCFHVSMLEELLDYSISLPSDIFQALCYSLTQLCVRKEHVRGTLFIYIQKQLLSGTVSSQIAGIHVSQIFEHCQVSSVQVNCCMLRKAAFRSWTVRPYFPRCCVF
jgi:hypothetical protein